MANEDVLTDLKSKMDKLAREIAQNEGSLKTISEQQKKEFGVNKVDEAYALLSKMRADIDVKRETRDELIGTAQEILAKYH